MALEFAYTVDPDAHGVFDGRDLARQMIGTAIGVLAPYVEGCPECMDKLFSKIANDVLEMAHEEARTGDGRIEGGLFAKGDAATREERQARHLVETIDRTADLLGVELHHHHGGAPAQPASSSGDLDDQLPF